MKNKTRYSSQPVIHRHILIIPSPVEGELWFDRYQEQEPGRDTYIDAVEVEVARTGHSGQYKVYRAPGVSKGTFLLAVRTLQGYIPYERDPKYQKTDHRTANRRRMEGNHGD